MEKQFTNSDPLNKEQQQEDGVAIDVLDHTKQFTTDQIFESKIELIDWTRTEGMRNNIVVVIRRSDTGKVGNKKKRPSIKFCCERSGQYVSYKSMKSNANIHEPEDVDGTKEKRQRLTGTKKCGCPFSLRGNNIENGDTWKLEVVCGFHNHTASKCLHAHFQQVRLTTGCPLPPVPLDWYPHADAKARSLLEKYKNRMEQYNRIPHPERVTLLSKTVELDDE